MKQIQASTMETEESQLVWRFFDCSRQGIFVEVGANHPKLHSQTWFLEQQGWSGILVEPTPELCELLRAQRPRSRIFQNAVGSPDQGGEVELYLGMADSQSTIAPVLKNPLSGKSVLVKLRTLDSLLAEAGIERIDYLSIDVEGMELEVLRGLSLEKYAPRLILLEEHRHSYKKHFYLRRHGYRLIKRTTVNNWYVPHNSSATVHTVNTFSERCRLFKKMWLNASFDILYRKLKTLVRGKR